MNRKQRTREDLERATRAIRARQEQRITFSGVRAAVRWYVETRPRMGSAHGLHPRTERIDDFGGKAPIEVDGGPGGDLDETLATLATITAALDRLEVYQHTWHKVILGYGAGMTQSEIGEEIGQSQRIVSMHLSKAEAYLAALLGGAYGVLRRPEAAPAHDGRRCEL